MAAMSKHKWNNLNGKNINEWKERRKKKYENITNMQIIYNNTMFNQRETGKNLK